MEAVKRTLKRGFEAVFGHAEEEAPRKTQRLSQEHSPAADPKTAETTDMQAASKTQRHDEFVQKPQKRSLDSAFEEADEQQVRKMQKLSGDQPGSIEAGDSNLVPNEESQQATRSKDSNIAESTNTTALEAILPQIPGPNNLAKSQNGEGASESDYQSAGHMKGGDGAMREYDRSGSLKLQDRRPPKRGHDDSFDEAVQEGPRKSQKKSAGPDTSLPEPPGRNDEVPDLGTEAAAPSHPLKISPTHAAFLQTSVQNGVLVPDHGDQPLRMQTVIDSGRHTPVLSLNNTQIRLFANAANASRRANILYNQAETKRKVLTQFREYAASERSAIADRWSAIEREPGKEFERQRLARESSELWAKIEQADAEEDAAQQAANDAEIQAQAAMAFALTPLDEVLTQAAIIGKDVMPADEAESLAALEKEFALPDQSQWHHDPMRLPHFQRKFRTPPPEEVVGHEFRDCHDQLQIIQRDFDQRRSLHSREARDLQWRLGRGEIVSETPTELDLRHVKRAGDLTRDLIDVEDRLRVARARAAKLGVDVSMNDQTSDFADQEEEGDRLSADDNPLQGPTSDPRILNWLESIPDVEQAEDWCISVLAAQHENFTEWKNPDTGEVVQLVEIDDWNDHLPVRKWESASVMAEGRDRKKIDQELQFRLRERDGAKEHWAESHRGGQRKPDWDSVHGYGGRGEDWHA